MPPRDFSRSTTPRKPRVVNKAPAARRDVPAPPRPDVQTGTGYKKPKAAPRPPVPKASWAKPIGRVNVAPPKPRTPIQKLPRDLRPSRAKHVATNRQLERRAARKYAESVVGRAGRSIDAYFSPIQGPPAPRYLASQRPVQGPPRPLVAGPPLPSRDYRGKIITYQQIQKDLLAVDNKNLPLPRRLRAVERLRIVGPVAANVPRTHNERVRADRATLARAQRDFLKQYRQLDKSAYGVPSLSNGLTRIVGGSPDRGLSDREVLDRIRGWSAEDIYKTLSAQQQKASAALLSKSQQQLMGFDPRGLITGAMGALEVGRDVIQDVAGDNLPANLAADALYLPMGLVGGAVMAASDPKAAWEGIKNGYIGSKIQGKDEQASQVAQAHPLFTFLELYGAAGAGGRAAGGAARGASRGRVAGLRRDPIALINQQGTGAIFERTYSKDVLRQAAQRLYDKTLKDGPEVVLRGEAVTSKRLTADRPVVGRVGKQRRSVSSEVEKHLINRFMDNVASRVNSLNRQDRDTNAYYGRMNAPVRDHRGGKVGQRIGAVIDRALPSQPTTRRGERFAERFPNAYRPERDVVTHALQGLIRNKKDEWTPQTFKRDLESERARLVAAAQKPDVTPDRIDAALDQVALITRVLETPKAWNNAKGVMRSADALGRRLNEQEGINVKLGLDPKAAERSKLFPFAQARMGAVYGPKVKEAAERRAVSAEAQAKTVRRDVEAQVARLKSDVAEATGRLRAVRERGANDAVALAGLKAAKRKLSQAEQQGRQRARAAQADAVRWRGEAARTRGQELHTVDGRRLSDEDIRTEMRKQGVDPDQVAYLSHSENSLGARAYYSPFDGTSRQNLNSQQARTGSLFEQGATEYRYNHALEQMVSHGTKAINAQQLDSMINEIAVTGPKTRENPDGYLTSKDFEVIAREAKRRGRPVTAVVARQQRLSDESLAALKETQNVAEASPGMGLLEAMWDARIMEGKTATKKNNLVAVEDQFLARLKAHIEVNGGGNLGGRALSSAFRKTVLPLSSKWLTGNVVEAIYRGIVIAGAVPLWDNRVAHRAWVEMLKADVKELGWDKGLAALDRYGAATGRRERRAAIRDMERFAPNARAAKAELIGGMFFGNKGLTNKGRNTTPEGLGQAVADSAAGRALNGTIDKINTPSFAFNRRFEQIMQNMVLGKHLRREMQEFQGSWVKAMRAQEEVLAKAAKGLLDTSGMVRAGKYLDETLGRYGRFSPRVRRLVQNGLPFLPWFLNSARFTFVTLPMKHPVKLAVMARVEAAFEKEWEEQHKDLSPDQRKGSLSGEYRRDDGSFTQFGRYLPTGLWAGVAAGDLGELGAPVLPQFSGILKALGGQDPFGSPLRVPGDDGKMRDLTTMEQIQYILNTGAETFTPLLGLGRRLQEEGQTSLPTSTIFSPRTKPNSHPAEPGFGAALDKVFNPGRGVYLRDPKKGQTYKSLDELYDALENDADDPADDLERKLERLYDEAGL